MEEKSYDELCGSRPENPMFKSFLIESESESEVEIDNWDFTGMAISSSGYGCDNNDDFPYELEYEYNGMNNNANLNVNRMSGNKRSYKENNLRNVTPRTAASSVLTADGRGSNHPTIMTPISSNSTLASMSTNRSLTTESSTFKLQSCFSEVNNHNRSRERQKQK